jgi:hypothetical protein
MPFIATGVWVNNHVYKPVIVPPVNPAQVGLTKQYLYQTGGPVLLESGLPLELEAAGPLVTTAITDGTGTITFVDGAGEMLVSSVGAPVSNPGPLLLETTGALGTQLLRFI